MNTAADAPWRAPVRALLLGAPVCFVLALLSSALARPHGMALIWLGDAVGVCLLLARPRREWPWTLLAVLLGNTGANLLAGDSLARSLAFAPANLGGMVLGAVLLQRHVPAASGSDGPGALARTLALGALVPALAGATLATLLVGAPLGIAPAPLWVGWVVSVTVGGITVLPLGRLLVQPGALGSLLPRTAVPALAVASAVALALRWLPDPLVWIATLLALCAATLAFPAVAACVAAASLAISLAAALDGPAAAGGGHLAAAWQGMAQALVLVPALLLAAQRAQSREFQARFDQLFERAREGIILGTPDGRVVAINPAAQRLCGHDLDSLRQLGRAGLMDMSDPRLAGLLQQRQSTGAASGSTRMLRAGGGTFEAELSSAVYQLPGGGWVSHTVFQDVSERDAQRQALQAGHDLLRRLSAMVPGVLFTLEQHPDGRLRLPWASDGLAPVFGLSPAEQAGLAESAEPLLRQCDPADLARFRAELAASASAMSMLQTELRLQHAERGVRWVALQAKPQRQDDGATLWHGYASDVSARRQDEERRGEQQRRTELAVLAGGIGLWDADLRTGVNVVNDRWSEMLGYRPGELASDVATFRSLVHPDDLPAVTGAERWSAAADGLSAPPVLARLRHRDGSWRWIEMRGMVTERDAAGWALRVSGTHIDVTERVLAEALRAERDRAAAANEAKTQFMSRMSHELRTPLNAVIGFAQLLGVDPERRLTEAQHQQVEQVLRASEHLLSLINDLLDLSRIEAGELPFEPEPLALGPALHAAADAVQALAARHGVALQLDDVDPGLHLQADRRRLQQVLLNLLSNACKYNRRGGQVRLSAGLVADGEPVVEVRVADTGIGLSPEQLEHLCEPFNRLGAESGPVEGTGIGLTITRRLLDRMGGQLQVQSEPGVGSVFAFRLPRAAAPAPGHPPAALAAGHPPAGPAAGRLLAAPLPALQGAAAAPAGAAAPVPRWHVLYVEDNPVNAMLLQQMTLRRPHIALELAESGALALQAVRRRRPDLLLVDMNLGDMSGLELRGLLQAEPGCADIPSIVLSADAMPQQVEMALRAGFDEYLTKPLKLSVLLDLYDRRLAAAATVA